MGMGVWMEIRVLEKMGAGIDFEVLQVCKFIFSFKSEWKCYVLNGNRNENGNVNGNGDGNCQIDAHRYPTLFFFKYYFCPPLWRTVHCR